MGNLVSLTSLNCSLNMNIIIFLSVWWSECIFAVLLLFCVCMFFCRVFTFNLVIFVKLIVNINLPLTLHTHSLYFHSGVTRLLKYHFHIKVVKKFRSWTSNVVWFNGDGGVVVQPEARSTYNKQVLGTTQPANERARRLVSRVTAAKRSEHGHPTSVATR